jgi:hypothetical protein
MFVVSVLDHGQERNIVATEVVLIDARLTIVSGDQQYEFSAKDLVQIIPVDKGAVRTDTALPEASRTIH